VEDSRRRQRRTWGWIAGGVGVAGVATGVVAGVLVFGIRGQQHSVCPGDACESGSVSHFGDLRSQASTLGWISNIGFGVGALALGVGGYLLLTTPSRDTAAALVTPMISPYGAGLSMTRHF
jgi:hypothetical protein